MRTGRLEAFSDGVLAIVITIMVLEMRVPEQAERFADLAPLTPALLSYVLSFIHVGIYWSNHHHLMHAVERVSGNVLWANLNLLFWLSLIPFTTRWMGQNGFASAPSALYGGVLLMAALAYWLLQRSILAQDGCDSVLAVALGRDLKGKLSLLLYLIAIPSAFLAPWIAASIYALVALAWIIPDPRIERALARGERPGR